MEPLPVVPAACDLDADGLRAQRERYRRIGEGATVRERGPRQLVVRLVEGVEGPLVAEALELERGCCPFFELEWDPEQRLVRVAVSSSEREPALDAIAFALGVE